MNDSIPYERFQRQLILREFGIQGQEKLARAKVLVIGAGGLGCPLLQYLTAAGVGTIGIVDHDVVSLSNLHRQVLYDMNDLGRPKVEVACNKLQQVDPNTIFMSWKQYLDQQLALEIFPAFDVIVDATDNFATRYLVNDACVLTGKPMVYGAVSRFEGQVAVFNFPANDSSAINYRDLFPEPPAAGEVLNCAEAGVLGVLPGVIGTMQATEVIKILTGIGKPLAGQLLCYRALDQQVYTLELPKHERGTGPGSAEEFLSFGYTLWCDGVIADEETAVLVEEGWTIVDVRELDEHPRLTLSHIPVPLGQLETHLDSLRDRNIIFICQSGKRSLRAVKLARELGINALSYKGGINRYIQQTETI